MDNQELLDEIKEAKKGNVWLFGSNREIRRLPNYLNSTEHVHHIITGSPLHGRGRGIVVATSERILFIKDGWVFRSTQDYPYDTLSTVEFRTGMFFGTLTVYGKGDEASFSWVGRIVGARFTKQARELSSTSKRTQYSPPTTTIQAVPEPVTPQQAIIQQLRDLEKLFQDGILSLDQYEIKKQELLNRL